MNAGNIIAAHNSKILATHYDEQNMYLKQNKSTTSKRTCNCRKKNECPLNGDCNHEAVVYQATATTNQETATYIGSTEGNFKRRFYGHKCDMNMYKNKCNTSLATFFWDNKTNNTTPTIKWKILEKCNKYKGATRKCDICLTEKLHILFNRDNPLNRRTELMTRCPHLRKFKLEHVKVL